MMKVCDALKQKILQCIIFAFTFIICFVPYASWAGALLAAAKDKGWYTKDCDLDKWADGKCLTCPLFAALFNAASHISLDAYNSLHAPLEKIIAIATAIWIAWKVIKYMSSFEAIEPWKMIQELGNQLFRSMVVVLILHANYFSVQELTVEPVLKTGLETAQFFSGKKTVGGNELGFTCDTSNTGSVESGGGLSPDVGNSMLCSVYGVERQAFDVIGVGATGRCLAYDRDVGWAIDLLFISFVIPSFNYIITGYLLMLIGLFFLIGCPLLLIDCVINMCFAVAVMPAAIACFAFKITSGHLKTVWTTLLNAIFNFIFMTVILYIMTAAVINIISGVQDGAGEAASGIKSFGSVLHGLSFVGLNFMKLAFVFFLGWSVLEKSAELAKTLVGGGLQPGKGMGSDIAKQAATAAYSAGSAGIQATGSALRATANATGLTAAAQEWRSKAAKSIRHSASAPLRFIKNSQARKAIHGVISDGAQKLGNWGKKKAYTLGSDISDFARNTGQQISNEIKMSSLGMAAYALKNSDAVKTVKLAAKVAAGEVALFANKASRYMQAAQIHRQRRAQEEAEHKAVEAERKSAIREQRAKKIKRVAADLAIGFIASRTGQVLFSIHDSEQARNLRAAVSRGAQNVRTAAGIGAQQVSKFASKAYRFGQNLSLEDVGTLIGHVGNAAAAVGAGAALATPVGQVAALSALASYGVGKKVVSPLARHSYVGIEFARSAIRVGMRNLDSRMAIGLNNIGMADELKQTFDHDGMLLSEKIRQDMAAHNNFDAKNSVIADKYLNWLSEKDKQSEAGKEVLEQRRQAHFNKAQDIHARFEQKKAEMKERQRQQHWENAQRAHEEFEQRRAENQARKAAQDAAVAEALEKKQAAMDATSQGQKNAKEAAIQHEMRRVATMPRIREAEGKMAHHFSKHALRQFAGEDDESFEGRKKTAEMNWMQQNLSKDDYRFYVEEQRLKAKQERNKDNPVQPQETERKSSYGYASNVQTERNIDTALKDMDKEYEQNLTNMMENLEKDGDLSAEDKYKMYEDYQKELDQKREADEMALLDAAIEQEKSAEEARLVAEQERREREERENYRPTATLTQEEEAAIREKAAEEFNIQLAQMKEAQAAEEAAARAAEEAKRAQEQAELDASIAKAKADEEARIAAEKAREEAQKEYERQLKEWNEYQNAQKTLYEKLFGIELSEEEIKRRERRQKHFEKMQAMWNEYERSQQEGNQQGGSDDA